MMHLMAEHREVQARMQAEVDRILMAPNGHPTTRPLWSLHRCRGARSDVAQTGRAGHRAAGHRDTVAVTFKPKGSGVYLLTGHAATKRDHFVDPKAFHPNDGWKPGRLAPAVTTPGVPSIRGGRYGLPSAIRDAEIKLVAAMLCRNFEVARAPNSPPTEEVFSFTMMPKNAWFTLQRRRI
jgi:cytochrome P450